MPKTNKAASTKELIEKRIGKDSNGWVVHYGQLKPGRGRPRKAKQLFQAVGEKLPIGLLHRVKSHMHAKGLSVTGVYVAHDSMGSPRYIGRGNIFGRLEASRKAHMLEIQYFSFYVVKEKQHEREIETLLIRAASPLLQFNTRKKRVDIEPGRVNDYEAGTKFYERQRKKGTNPALRFRRNTKAGT